MKSTDKNQDQQQQQGVSSPTVDRREFLGGTVSLGAAVLGAGVLANSGFASAEEGGVPTIDWKTVEAGDRANDLYAPQEGFNDTDATWWPGRNFSGVSMRSCTAIW